MPDNAVSRNQNLQMHCCENLKTPLVYIGFILIASSVTEVHAFPLPHPNTSLTPCSVVRHSEVTFGGIKATYFPIFMLILLE